MALTVGGFTVGLLDPSGQADVPGTDADAAAKEMRLIFSKSNVGNFGIRLSKFSYFLGDLKYGDKSNWTKGQFENMAKSLIRSNWLKSIGINNTPNGWKKLMDYAGAAFENGVDQAANKTGTIVKQLEISGKKVNFGFEMNVNTNMYELTTISVPDLNKQVGSK